MTSGHRILLIDSYDSFSFNLSSLISKVTGSTVVSIRNDAVTSLDLRQKVLPYFDAVVIGPGPGTPENPHDIGTLQSIWGLEESAILPVFGVCLGFQSLMYSCGELVVKAPSVKHGQLAYIRHDGSELFTDVPQEFPSIRYHSLCVKDPASGPSDEISFTAWTSDTLADGSTISLPMAGRHNTKPFWGVQYHPESICSEYGDVVMRNFWNQAQKWNISNNRLVRSDPTEFSKIERLVSIKPSPMIPSTEPHTQLDAEITLEEIHYTKNKICVVEICESLKDDFALLHSGAEPGRWSIIGVLENGVTSTIKHYTSKDSDFVYMGKWKSQDPTADVKIPLNSKGIWPYLCSHMSNKLNNYESRLGGKSLPFIGGIIGYFSYEEGCDGIDHLVADEPELDYEGRGYADTNLLDVERTILVDSLEKKIYIISLKPRDGEWIQDTKATLQSIVDSREPSVIKTTQLPVPAAVSFPDEQRYKTKIKESQEHLLRGDSYELCITGQTRIEFKEQIDPWSLYKHLLGKNPSPYSCYLNFSDAVLVGASPERFMSWNRDGVCEFRPIKGTVRRGTGITKEQAHEILQSDKERGENLMIVDLIRHDLNQLLDEVWVDKLMTVEEYTTVYQLVSVISGKLCNGYRGIDILSNSLPPGSMTGAPKIRSVQLLRGLEDYKPRGIYSGVAGYWSVHDTGDWSIIIRSAFSYKSHPNEWRIGAGGAITVLSDIQSEWEEMKVKLDSALRAFEENFVR